MLLCVMCLTNTGSIEFGKIADKWYSIDKIIVKMSNGKRLTRYAVCVNGRWDSNQYMTLREARAYVARLQKERIEELAYAMYI